MKLKETLAALVVGTDLLGTGQPVVQKGQAKKIPLTPKQKKQRAKNKIAKKSRKINRK